MIPKYLNPSGYVSCIKISGEPILPPLITEERRKELNADKEKAMEIEKKLVRKRSSVDSGVMTGSYIESFKNCELQKTENMFCQLSLSDLVSNENIQTDDVNISSCELDSISTDGFLRAALEDIEFREFFYSTAERIFTDNNVVNTNKDISNNNFFPHEINSGNQEVLKEYEKAVNSEMSSHLSKYLNTNELLDVSVCSNLTLTPSPVSYDNVSKQSETDNKESLPKIVIEEPLSPPNRSIRRNSYTLENPSPILLEHLAKENAKNKQENDKWKVLSEKKEKNKGLGFKTFSSTKKPRKTWNKKIVDHPSTSKSDHTPVTKTTRSVLKRNKTFVKRPGTKNEEINYSLPCSSRSSPVLLSSLAHSVDCIPSTVVKQDSTQNKLEFITDLNHEPDKEVKTIKKADPGVGNYKNIANTNTSIVFGSSKPHTSNTCLQNNMSGSLHSNCDADTCDPPRDDPSDSSSQVSATTLNTFFHQNDFKRNNNGIYFESDTDQTVEIDDSVSVSSSLSLSKFLPFDDNGSRASNTEDFSVLYSELQRQHECQIAELLEKQHKEKVLLSELHSSCGTSSRSITTLSNFELPLEHDFSGTSCSEEMEGSCRRQLFPTQNFQTTKDVQPKNRDYNSSKVKDAALKLTSCARGYLTRRLFKTEKVQLLIEVIKESLTCAFSLQSEADLKKDDFELYKRLEHQLNAAFYELHAIMSAPTAKRMAIIAADREKQRNPVSRPSSAISSATQKSILRRQQSLNNSERKPKESRSRTKSLCLHRNSGGTRPSSLVKSDSSSVPSSTSNLKPWR